MTTPRQNAAPFQEGNSFDSETSVRHDICHLADIPELEIQSMLKPHLVYLCLANNARFAWADKVTKLRAILVALRREKIAERDARSAEENKSVDIMALRELWRRPTTHRPLPTHRPPRTLLMV
jgi:hypothetical protein